MSHIHYRNTEETRGHDGHVKGQISISSILPDYRCLAMSFPLWAAASVLVPGFEKTATAAPADPGANYLSPGASWCSNANLAGECSYFHPSNQPLARKSAINNINSAIH